MIDPKLREFLQTQVNSFVKWDLVRFFHDNPHAKDTVENIAHYTGRKTRAIADELDELVASGVLRAKDINDYRVYMLIDDADTRERLHHFMQACEDREFRVQAIHLVIQGMQFSPRHDYSG